MALSKVDRNYYEQFGDKIPYQYFDDRDEAQQVAQDALDNGVALSPEEWLAAAGYTDAAIEQIQDGDLLI